MRRSLARCLVSLCFVSVGCANAEEPTVPVEEVEDTDVADSVAADTTVPVDTATEDTAVADTGTADTRDASVTDTGRADARADTRDAGSDTRDASVTDSSVADTATAADGSDDTTVDDTSSDDAADDASTDAAIDDVSTDAATDANTDSGATCHVVINEFQTGDSANGREWIELFNPCPTTISVANFSVVYRGNAGTSDVQLHKFAAAGSLTSGQYFVIANSKFPGTWDVEFTNPNQFAIGGGAFAIRNASGARVDSVGYGTATAATTFIEGTKAPAPDDVSPARSLARKVNGVDTNNNADDFAVTTTPTPKAANVITP